MKKLLFLCVAALMCLAPLAACTAAPSAAPTDAATPAATTADVATVEPSAEPTPSAAAEGPLTKFDPPVDVTMALDFGIDPKFPEGQDFENNIWLTEYRDLLGINVKYTWNAAGLENYETKLNLAIASGELADLICITNQGQLARLVEAGMIAEMGDTYEKFASPLVKEGFASDEGLAMKQTSINGKLWAIPQGPVGPSNFEYTYIREDWRLKLGLDVPKTTEDLLAIAEAFATKDPDGNGKADTYGILFSNEPYENYFNFRGFANSFGAYPTTWIKGADGKLVYGSVQPEMKAALAAAADLYTKGAIDKEFVAKKSSAITADAVGGKGGICFGQFWLITWPLPDTNKNNGDNSTQYWKPYPILNTAAATANKGSMVQSRVTTMYAVNKSYAHPEALLKMYNLFADHMRGDTFDAAKYHTDPKTSNGIFGLAPVQSWGVSNNNAVQNINVTKAIDSGDTSVLANAEQEATYAAVKEYVDGNHDAAHLTQYYLFYGPDSVFGIQNNILENKNYTNDMFYGGDTPEMLRRMSLLRSQELALILDIITGNKPVDDFDAFVANWYAVGGETITFEVNQWYDSVK